MPQMRDTYGFELSSSGALADNPENLERLRWLFRDGQLVAGQWGPGDPGDFDHGGWHVLCHLAGASAVARLVGGLAWCGITHRSAVDAYEATMTFRSGADLQTLPIRSPEATQLLAGASYVAFVEGSSLGHICARGVNDPPDAFNKWPRQRFDQGVSSLDDGGTVWEHWSTTRDLRATSAIGTSVLDAWLALVARLGGRFVAAVARGRREHSHPEQLVAMVRAGLISAEEATWAVEPTPIPSAAESLLYEARPEDALSAAHGLPLKPGELSYFMFARRIDRWSGAEQVRADLSSGGGHQEP